VVPKNWVSIEARAVAVSWLRRLRVVIVRGAETVDGQLSGEQVGVDVVRADGGIVIFEMAEEASAVFLPRMSIESAAEESEANVAILAGVADLNVDLSGVGVEFLVAFNAVDAEFASGEIGLQIGFCGDLDYDVESAITGAADVDVCGGAIDLGVDAGGVLEIVSVGVVDADLVVGRAANLVVTGREVKRDAAALREVVFDRALDASARSIDIALVDPEGTDDNEYDKADGDDLEESEHGQTSGRR
jgi:hypothetical protein